MRVTCYVLEDGSVVDPSDVQSDAAGVLRHRDGRAVAMRGDVPRTRSVDASAPRQMQPQSQPQPQQSGLGYLTRDADTGDELGALRAQYAEAFGKRPFHGWDAAALREKIAAAPKAE